MLSKDHNMLAATLAEKLCFRTSAFVKWVNRQKITGEQLIELHRELHKQGRTSDFSTAILVAFVNDLPYSKIWVV